MSKNLFTLLGERPATRSVLVSILAIIVACTTGAAVAQQKPTNVSVRMDYFAGPEQAGFWVAKAKGYYSEVGLNVDVKEGQGSLTTAQVVAAGQDKFGIITGDALIRTNAKGGTLVMVSMPIQDTGFGIAVKADGPIKEPKQLEGHTYGDTSAAVTTLMLPLMCQKKGIDYSKIKVVLVPAQALTPGFLEDKFDSVQASAWNPSNLVAKGPIRFFGYTDNGVPTPGWGIVATAQTLKSDSALVRTFVKATMRGYDYAQAHPEELLSIITSQVSNYQYNQQKNLDAMKLFAWHSKNTKGKPLGWMSPDDWREWIDVYKTAKMVENPPAPESLFTNQFVE